MPRFYAVLVLVGSVLALALIHGVTWTQVARAAGW